MKIKRGQIFRVTSNGDVPQMYSEYYGERPAIVVSNDKFNLFSDVVEIVYLTTANKKPLPTHCKINSSGRTSIAMCEQVHSVAKERLGAYMGDVREEEMAEVERCLKVSLGLTEDKGTVRVTDDGIYKKLYEDLLDKIIKGRATA